MTLRSASKGRSILCLLRSTALVFLVIVAPMHGSRAADFAVTPMSLELGQGARSGEIQVRNLDRQPIRFQIGGADWSQDESGKNIYTDSKLLIWFPRAVELAPGEARIIRVGVRVTPAYREQAFTIFLREVPIEGARGENARGAQIRLLLSVAVPVFVPPVKPVPGGAVESIELRDGSLNVDIANGGNTHFSYREIMLSGLGPDGSEQFTKKMRGGTLLAGSRKQVSVKVPQEVCARLRELKLLLITSEQSEIKRRLDVSRDDCK